MLGVAILAGGAGKRMGGLDKGLCLYQGVSFIDHVIAEIEFQARFLDEPVQIVISANRNIDVYKKNGVPVVTDLRGGCSDFQGPLAGIEAVLSYGVTHQVSHWIVVPVDSIRLPSNYLQGLIATQLQGSQKQVVVMSVLGIRHYSHLYLQGSKLASIKHYLDRGGRSIKGWVAGCGHTFVGMNLKDSNLLNVNSGNV
ncbi:hypothetical protein CYQ88_03460 [Hydrogenovibrio sp. SC-1]|uniref:molybdenum cofactor guanylyltransferase n=1 Tax=Hydrogenovibrio sp. SC-1 TaxID=2065820 RepID=UPI000C79F107|nr:NTP transferase domain-containing protein [Hydrogenovibrio sp. SC-1]PLA74970.1 hypothetical protein CYQ88_03460 [Hydrogenovibrio sp. SC-1]